MASLPIAIVPSVLPADFSRLADECAALEKAGADRIQWDVMDGQFVPNLTFGPDMIAACRPHTSLPFEAHLMVETPELLLPRYVEAGCEIVIVHAESTRHLHRALGQVRELGARAGVAINPATPALAVAHVVDLVDLVLVMTVNPGFGGQRYLATMEPKIAEVRRIIDESARDLGGRTGGRRALEGRARDEVDLEVDGGIAPDTAGGAVRAGANVLVTGSALFRDPEGLEHAVAEIRRAAAAPPR
ncbi:MAG: ribulose-phosphate 3-epimerase [Acidimicrobiales bacterium]